MIPIILLIIVASINLLTQAETALIPVLIRRYSKALLMPSLLLVYVFNADDVSIFIVLALTLGWIGDLFLMGFRKSKYNPAVIIEEPNWSFLVGLSFFLLGHIFYVIYFFNLVDWQMVDPLFYGLFVILFWYGLIILKGIKPQGTMLIGVSLYMLVIGSMIGSTFALCHTELSLSTAFVAMGAMLFGSSDSVLAFRQIKNIKTLPMSYIMFSYISGQFLIILGIM